MSYMEDCSPGGFIHSPRFHPYVAIFNDVDTANTIFPPDLIQPGQQVCRGVTLPINPHGNAVFEIDLDILRSVVSPLR